jgi:hypothetical protein
MTAAPKGRIAWSDLLRDHNERAALTEAVDHEIARAGGAPVDHLRELRAALASERGKASWGRLIHTDEDREALFRAVIHEIGPLSAAASRDPRMRQRLKALRDLLDRLTL